jgi:hypothetical protein
VAHHDLIDFSGVVIILNLDQIKRRRSIMDTEMLNQLTPLAPLAWQLAQQTGQKFFDVLTQMLGQNLAERLADLVRNREGQVRTVNIETQEGQRQVAALLFQALGEQPDQARQLRSDIRATLVQRLSDPNWFTPDELEQIMGRLGYSRGEILIGGGAGYTQAGFAQALIDKVMANRQIGRLLTIIMELKPWWFKG